MKINSLCVWSDIIKSYAPYFARIYACTYATKYCIYLLLCKPHVEGKCTGNY